MSMDKIKESELYPVLNEEKAQKGADSTFMGKRVGDMTHEELCALVWWFHDAHEERRVLHEQHVGFLKGCKWLR